MTKEKLSQLSNNYSIDYFKLKSFNLCRKYSI